jgi:hypothetical protein
MSINLIGISGKIGSGKDTVGKIIQHLITEYNSYYKITNIKSVSIIFNNCEEHSDWEIKKFADKLKKIASILTGISTSQFEDPKFKESFLDKEWVDSNYMPLTVRRFLQCLGTDAIRDKVCANTWVNATFSDWFNGCKWILTDMRFPNEFKAIKERGGINIRIIRDSDNENNHLSETALDNYKFDYTINNNGTIEQLKNLVREILINEKIIK